MGMLASGNPKKGHLFAVETWKQLGKPGALVLAGNLPDDLRRECEREGAICPGFVEAGPFLRSIDLLLVPSTAEGIPTVILEAAARGVPTLATPVGGVPEMIKHGQTGYVLERNEWLEFLRKTPSDQWRRTGVAAKHQLPNRFSMERMARRFRAAAWLAAHPTFAKRWRARG
jgi:glycosyltransferase involved in cell wall biosynthesis